MSVKIIHPDKSFTGNAINLDFTSGEAEVKSLSKEARTVLSENGFTVKNIEPTAAEKSAAEKARADKEAADKAERLAAEEKAAAEKK
ncbi:membrane protein involved in colicin uptake [Microbacterium resistens]|uniref:Membrane protein involved in colicin uptake n=1 Tax=Microbacterium resistens TaxID=156977 RepID=A0ABU1SEJ3_9MICO|nr:hypothetical protein [Microbacterium resistens]MDR6867678.1 membrane protein involved in colicin uptake [Microbacterium resistens]